MNTIVFAQFATNARTPDEIKHEHEYECRELKKLGLDLDVVVLDEHDEDKYINACKEYRIILCGGNPPLTEYVVECLPKCEVIIRYGVGINSIDMDACAKHNKLVYFMPGYCKEELAIHATALILSLIRSTAFYDRKMRKGEFPKARGILPRRLCNMVVGIYGFGTASIELTKIMKNGFGAEVITCDPYVKPEFAEKYGAKLVSFEDLIAQSDVISIHAPLTAETRHVFNKSVFQKMKPSAILINTARGPLVDESDLYEALVNKEIAGAGLDVFEKEPVTEDNPLLQLDNVVLTPHSAFHGEEAGKIQFEYSVDFMRGYLVDKVIYSNCVGNKKVLPFFENLNYEIKARYEK